MNFLEIPVFLPRFAYKANPLYTYENATRWSNEVLETSLMKGDGYNKLKNCGLFSAYIWPECDDPNKFEILTKLIMSLFIFDDHIECDYGDVGHDVEKCQIICGQFNSALDKLVSNQFISMANWRPYIKDFFAFNETMFNAFNETQKRRSVNCSKEYIQGVIEEVLLYENNIELDNVEELMKVRMKSFGMWQFFPMIEYANNILINEQDWNNEKLQRLISLTIKHMMYVNDIFSLEKELNENNGAINKLYNTVALISRTDKIGIKESMNKVIDMTDKAELEFIRLESELTTDPGTSAEVKIMLTNMRYFLSGNYKFSLDNDRYKVSTIKSIMPRNSFTSKLLI